MCRNLKSNPKTGICAVYRMKNAITVQNNVHLEKLLTTDPTMEQYMRTAIDYVLQQARKDTVNEISSVLKNDPRHAARAVRRSLYKQILGGQINILRKKKASSRVEVPPSTRGRLAETTRYLSYQGSDRSFVLRFLNAGTVDRVATHMNGRRILRTERTGNRQYITTKIGSRGSILPRNFFGPASKAAMEEAAVLLAKELERIVKELTQ